jgi:hypothetical protein
MKEYIIKENGSQEIILIFLFDKTSTIISILFSIVLFGVIFFNIDLDTFKRIWIALILLFCVLFYLTSNQYFEWRRNRYSKLFIEDENVIINDKFYSAKHQIKSVNIVYSVNKYELGWTVYIKKHRESENYIIKKRLKEEDAKFIADKLGIFLDRNTIVD